MTTLEEHLQVLEDLIELTARAIPECDCTGPVHSPACAFNVGQVMTRRRIVDAIDKHLGDPGWEAALYWKPTDPELARHLQEEVN